MTEKKRTPRPAVMPQKAPPPPPSPPAEPVVTFVMPQPAPGECRVLGCGQPGNHPGSLCCEHHRGAA